MRKKYPEKHTLSLCIKAKKFSLPYSKAQANCSEENRHTLTVCIQSVDVILLSKAMLVTQIIKKNSIKTLFKYYFTSFFMLYNIF